MNRWNMKSKTIITVVIIILVILIGAFLFIQANSHNTKVDVISNSTLKNGDNVQIVLTDEYRNLYPGEKVQIKILDDSGWANYYDVVTDNSGLCHGMKPSVLRSVTFNTVERPDIPEKYSIVTGSAAPKHT